LPGYAAYRDKKVVGVFVRFSCAFTDDDDDDDGDDDDDALSISCF
jgi:hypothetical protein